MSILCRIGIHKWSKYGSVVTGYKGLRRFMSQFRSCDKCGKVGYRSFSCNQVSVDKVKESLNKINKIESK